jgi:hypothetical protein
MPFRGGEVDRGSKTGIENAEKGTDARLLPQRGFSYACEVSRTPETADHVQTEIFQVRRTVRIRKREREREKEGE